MYVLVVPILCAFISVGARDLLEPKLQVPGPDELVVKVPRYEGMELVTFRIGVRRKDKDLEDLERGENSLKGDYVFIYDDRLNLKIGDVVNYLLGYKDNLGYHAKTGQYVFDGVYQKLPISRRRRGAWASTTESTTVEDDDTEGTTDVDFTQSRFGGGGYHHHRHHPKHWQDHNGNGYGFGYPPGGGYYNQYRGYPAPYPGPYPRPHHGYHGHQQHFQVNCDDHRHDLCHNNNNPFPGRGDKSQGRTTTSTTTSTTTDLPDIDIRFAQD